MKKRRLTTILLLSFFCISFNSCAVINSLLGINETCAYPDCNNFCAENSIYCTSHNHNNYYYDNVPYDLEKKADKAINKSLEKYRGKQGKVF